MANVVVVGSQWGDEGKGKIVDWLSERADIVVRFQGGHNAGHTLVVDGTTYKLSLLPSGVVRKGKLSVIGNGVVVDPWALADEIAKIEKLGVKHQPRQSPHRRERDADPAAAPRARLAARGCRGRRADRHDQARHRPGLRGQGRPARHQGDGPPGPARRSSRRSSASSPTTIRFAAGLGQPEISADDLCAQLTEIAPKILPLCRYGVGAARSGKRRQGKRILFEGAQGALLDIDHGTYPFVTSSNTVAAQAATGSGVGPGAIGYVLGITKAYTTRVGEGPFPTELKDETGKLLGERGAEFGTVTGRPRRCGWFDACLVRQTRKVAGINGIALTKLDVLDQLPELKICVGYRLDGLPLDHLPAAQGAQARVVPIYETMEGWTRIDARRAVLGRAARAMHQICAAARGADRRAGGAALDQPEARGHHPRARSLRGLECAAGWSTCLRHGRACPGIHVCESFAGSSWITGFARLWRE